MEIIIFSVFITVFTAVKTKVTLPSLIAVRVLNIDTISTV